MARRIAVVGGGVVGCSVAWHMAQRELGEVVLIEPSGSATASYVTETDVPLFTSLPDGSTTWAWIVL